MTLEEFRRKHEELDRESKETYEKFDIVGQEIGRVAEVAENTRDILDDLDDQFANKTGLEKTDFAFLFVAIALQCVRIYFMNDLTKIEKAGAGNRNEKKLHEVQNKVLKHLDNSKELNPGLYYAPRNQIITGRGVPYDATGFAFEKQSFFKGANHRFATLGHDPILGLIFGTSNILTNTITCVNKPFITTSHVIYDENMKNPRIGMPASSMVMLEKTYDRFRTDMASVVAAIIKQIIHIGTDMYTPCGIQLPGMNVLTDNKTAEKITKYISTGDLVKIGASAGMSVFVNTIISVLHMLLYDPQKYEDMNLYNVKTRKIIMISNSIASGSNVIWVGANMAAGNEAAIKNLDIGGLIITIQRLYKDSKFIREVKQEYIFGTFDRMMQGDI